MNNIYVVCKARLIEPYEASISKIYCLGTVKGWRLLKASTSDDYARVAIAFDTFKQYYSETPKREKQYDAVPGTGKFIDHMIVEDIRDLTV